MIQRLQSLYLLLLFFFSAYLFFALTPVQTDTLFAAYYGFVLTPVLSLVCLLWFKKRPIQARLCVLLLMVQVVQIGFYLPSLMQSGGNGESILVVVLSGIHFILLLLARRGILKDEALVRSVDRIR